MFSFQGNTALHVAYIYSNNPTEDVLKEEYRKRGLNQVSVTIT